MKRFKGLSVALLWVACISCLCFGVYAAASFTFNINGVLGIIPSHNYEAVTLPADWFSHMSDVTTDKTAVQSISLTKRSAAQDESYIEIPDGPNISYTGSAGAYSVEIWWPETIYAPIYSGYLFSDLVVSNAFSNVSSISFTNFDTSRATDMEYMFTGFAFTSKIPTLNLSTFNTSAVADMQHMFDTCGANAITLSSFSTSMVKDMKYMFSYCTSLTSLSLPTNFTTTQVTDMQYMFNGCSALSSITFPTNLYSSLVTNMQYMFNGCSKLTSLALTSFSTSAVTDMQYMFNGCSALKTLNLSSFNLAKLTSYSNMFTGCSVLETIYTPKYSGTDSTTYAITLPGVFRSSYTAGRATALTKSHISAYGSYTLSRIAELTKDWYTQSGTTYAKSNWTSINIYGGQSYTGSLYMHLEDYNDLSIYRYSNGLYIYSKYNIYTAPDSSYMFADTSASSSFTNLSSFSTNSSVSFSHTSNMNHMFYGCSKLTSFSLGASSSVSSADMSDMFSRCTSLVTLDLSKIGGSSKSMSWMFIGCTSLTEVNLSNLTISSAPIDMFYNCSALQVIKTPKGSFSGNESLPDTYISTSHTTTTVLSTSFLGTTLLKLSAVTLPTDWKAQVEAAGIDCTFIQNIAFKTASSLSSEYTKLLQIGLIKIGYKNISAQYNSLEIISSYTIYSPGDSSSLFALDTDIGSALDTITFSNFNTSLTTNMSSMFKSCSNLGDLDLTSFNTSKVTSFSYMFSNCASLKSVDLSSFNTEASSSFVWMFNMCSGLKSLDLSSFNFVFAGGQHTNIFAGCTSIDVLVAPRGIEGFNTISMPGAATNVSAGIATGSTPNVYVYGDETTTELTENYFSTIGSPKTLLKLSSVTLPTRLIQTLSSAASSLGPGSGGTLDIQFRQASSALSGYSNLTTYGFINVSYKRDTLRFYLDIYSPYKIFAPSDSSYMFYDMVAQLGRVTTIDYSNFNTSQVTNMSYMFQDCSYYGNGECISLPFNTSKVTNMNYMFNRCTTLEGLDLSYMDFKLNPTCTDIFKDCTSLQYIKTPQYSGTGSYPSIPLPERYRLARTVAAGVYDTSTLSAGTELYRNITITKDWFTKYTTGTLGGVTMTASLVETLKFAVGYTSSRPTGYSLKSSENGIAYFYKKLSSNNYSLIIQSMGLFTAPVDSSYLFAGTTRDKCYINMTSIDFENFCMFSSTTNISYMFLYCEKLTSIPLTSTHFDCYNITDIQRMFGHCLALTSMDLSSLVLHKVTNMTRLFYNCAALSTVVMPTNTVATSTTEMFALCNKLTSVDLYGMDLKNNTAPKMFTNMTATFASLQIIAPKNSGTVGTASNYTLPTPPTTHSYGWTVFYQSGTPVGSVTYMTRFSTSSTKYVYRLVAG